MGEGGAGWEHWPYLMSRRKTCALLRTKTSALLRHKTYAVWTCALFRANTKETTEGGGLRPPPSVVAAEGRHICIGFEQSTYPSPQHSTRLASQQGRCLGAQQGTCLTSQHLDMPRVHSQYKGCGLRPPPFVVLALSKAPVPVLNTQHNACLASQQGRCIGSQQGTCLTSQH